MAWMGKYDPTIEFLGGVPEGSHTSTISVFRLSVRPSVRLSVTEICYREDLKIDPLQKILYSLGLLQNLRSVTEP